MELVKYLSRLSKDDILEIGQYADGLGKLLSSGIPIPPAFLLSNNALHYFLDFTNIRDYLNKSVLENVVNFRRIERLFLDAAIPPVLTNEISQAYTRISGFVEGYVHLKPLCFTKTFSYPIDQSKQRIVLGAEALCQDVVKMWAESATSSREFLQAILAEDLRISVMVQKLPLEEVSGKLNTSDMASGNRDQMWIEAVYGMWDITQKDGLIPDQYIFSKKKNLPVDKHVSKQKTMMIRQLNKTTPSLEAIAVSTVWQTMPKLNDKYITHLAGIGSAIEEFYRVPCEVSWVYESGRLWVVDIDPLEKEAVRNITSKKTPDSPSLVVSTSDDSKTLIKKPKMWSKTIKTKDVIARGEGNAEGYVEGVATKVFARERRKKEGKSNAILVVADISLLDEELLNNFGGIIADHGNKDDNIISRTQMIGIPLVYDTAISTRAIKEGDQLWIDTVRGIVYRAPNKKQKNGRSLEISSTKQPYDKKKYEKTATKLLIEYTRIGQKEVLQSDSIALIVDGMIFNAKNSFDGYISELIDTFNIQGKCALASVPAVSWLEAMAKEVYSSRNQKKQRGIWMAMPPYQSLEELREAKHLMLDIGLRRTSTFKLFISIRRPSQLFNILDYSDVGIDGVLIDVPAIQHDMSGRVLNRLMPETLKPLSAFCKETNIHGIETYLRMGELKISKPSLEKLLRSGVYAFSSSDIEYIPKLKNLIGDIEKDIITRTL